MRLTILWSVPRSRSTVFERMLFERSDLECLHEPLSRVSDFGSVEVLGVRCASQTEVVRRLIEVAASRPVFVKDTTDFPMTEALTTTELLFTRARHAVMWREPRSTIESHLRLAPEATESDIGYVHMLEVVRAIQSSGAAPFFIEGDHFAQAPIPTYQRFCVAFGLTPHLKADTFTREAPPEWQQTARWHTEAASSTSVSAPRADERRPPLNETSAARLADLLLLVTPTYERLNALVDAPSRVELR